MTISISLKTPEGIVLGADSTTTVTMPTGQVAQLFNSAQKIFEIGPANNQFIAGVHFSAGVATYNAGSFGPVSWRNVVSDFFREKIRDGVAPIDVSRELLAFCQTKWAQLQQAGICAWGCTHPRRWLLTATINRCEGEVVWLAR